MKKKYSSLIAMMVILLFGCNTPSVPQPIDECNPPTSAINQSPALNLAGGSLYFDWTANSKSIIFSVPFDTLYQVDTPVNQIWVPEATVKQVAFRKVFMTNANAFAISPTASSITYASEDSTQKLASIFILDQEINNERQLTNKPFHDTGLIWHPDGKHITFRRNDGKQNLTRIYTVHIKTGVEQLLIDFPAWDYSWSPSGEMMVFISNQDGTDDIYTFQSNGDTAKIVDTFVCDKAQHPTWSPVDHRLAYIHWHNFSSDLVLVNSDGSTRVNLTNSANNEYQPTWSPDGQQLAYVSFDGTNQEISITNIDGSDNFNLTNTSEFMESLPKWSPDGRWIAFISFAPDKREYYLEVIELQSGNRSVLSTIKH